MKILISGGGIGGLAAALCLSRTGHSVTVFEQAEAFTEVGAGLQVSPNGMKVLRALGLETAARAAGFEPERIEMRFGRSGQTVFSIPLKGFAERRWGAPYLQFHRADLLGVLVEAVRSDPSITVMMSSRVMSCDIRQDQIGVRLTSGGICHGDLLIGADGIHSVVRESLPGADTPRFTGCVAWRGTVPLDALKSHPPPPTACAWVGPGRHAVTYRLGAERLVNFVGVVEQAHFEDESWSTEGSRDQLRRDFAGWHPVLQEIIETGDAFFRWGLFTRAPLTCWQSERIVLLGDAAHPMLPFLAQGAVMAIEDGYVLAQCLSDEGVALNERLKRFEMMRKPRCTAVQAGAHRNKTLFHLENPALRLGVYGAMRLGAMVVPQAVQAQMDWIYGHDVTLRS